MRPGVIEAVVRGIEEVARKDELTPGVPRLLGALETQAIDVQRPAVAEVAGTMVPAVIGPSYGDRHAGERQLEVLKGSGELAYLHVAVDKEGKVVRSLTGIRQVGHDQAH